MLLLIAAAALAPAVAPEPPLRAELEPMRFLVGHCWRGEMKGGAEQDIHCFEPVFEGQHIRDRHEVTGAAAPYRGETLYSWNGAAGRIDYVYWNSIGGVSRGSMVAKPGLFDFGDDLYRSPDGREIRYSTIWRKTSERGYEAVTVSAANPTGERVVRFTRVD
jgi:hypothetical protein